MRLGSAKSLMRSAQSRLEHENRHSACEVQLALDDVASGIARTPLLLFAPSTTLLDKMYVGTLGLAFDWSVNDYAAQAESVIASQ